MPSQATLGDLALGKGPSAGPAISWICGFNIPIITICAFIVLNIFPQSCSTSFSGGCRS